MNIPYVFLTQSYWRDEVFRVFMAQKSFVDIVKLTYNDAQPPLYYYILKIWMLVFGDGEIATRLLSVIFFLTLVVVVYFFAKLLTPSKYYPFLASFLILINPSLVYYAFETRVYILFVLMVTFSCYFLFKKKYWLWIIVSILALYTNNFMVFVIPFQILWLFFQKLKKIKIITYGLIILIGYLPWFGVFIHQSFIVKNDFWISPLTNKTIRAALSGVFLGYEFDPLSHVGRFSLLSLLLLPVLFLSLRSKQGRFLLLWFLGPFLTAIVISIFTRPIFSPRYLSFLVVPMTLMIYYQLYKLPFKVMLPFFIIISYILFTVNFLLYPVRLKPDIRSTVKKVAEIIEPGDVIIADTLNYFETKYYFAKFTPTGYTESIKILIYQPTGELPFFVGKVLIPNENITDKVFTNQRIFKIDQKANYTIIPGS